LVDRGVRSPTGEPSAKKLSFLYREAVANGLFEHRAQGIGDFFGGGEPDIDTTCRFALPDG
jgi:hypothetical protein